MKSMIKRGVKPLDSHEKAPGQRWSLLEKVFLGLTPADYLKQAVRNPMNWILGLAMLIGFPFIVERFIFGLGAVTHSSNDYPWGLFLGFGLFTMVPLSASGFMLGTTVEVFGRHDFEPIERVALLNGLLGYFFGNTPIIKENFGLAIIGVILISLVPIFVEAWRARRANARVSS